MILIISIVSAVELNTTPKELTYADGLVELKSKKPWSDAYFRANRQGYLLFYVDPDEETFNKHIEEKLDKAFKEYDDKFKNSITIVNMAASWIPNVLINPVIKEREKKYPYNKFVLDYNKTMVKKWGLEDDAYQVLIISNEGKIVYANHNKLTDEEVEEVRVILKGQIDAYIKEHNILR